ncbi:hypothetical protein [Citrobacter portucalensis]
MMNPVPWLQMTNMISYQGLVRTFPNSQGDIQLFINPDCATGKVLLYRKD